MAMAFLSGQPLPDKKAVACFRRPLRLGPRRL